MKELKVQTLGIMARNCDDVIPVSSSVRKQLLLLQQNGLSRGAEQRQI